MKQLLLPLLLVFSACTDSQLAETNTSRARELLQQQKLPEALSVIEQSISAAPTADAYNLRGVIYFEQGEYATSLNSFEQAIELDSTDYRFYLNRGNAQRYLKQVQAAYSSYSKAIDLDSIQSDTYLNRGIVNLNLLRLQPALADFAAAERASGGKEAAVYLYRGKAMLRAERFADAQADLLRYNQLQPDNAEALFNLALARSGLYGQADDTTCIYLSRSSALNFAPAKAAEAEYCQ